MYEVAVNFTHLEIILFHLRIKRHLVVQPRPTGVVATIHVESHVSTHSNTVVADSAVLVWVSLFVITFVVCNYFTRYWVNEMLTIMMPVFGALM